MYKLIDQKYFYHKNLYIQVILDIDGLKIKKKHLRIAISPLP